MEIRSALSIAAGSLALLSSAAMSMDIKRIDDVYVADFKSDDIEHCRPSDVDLTHSQARDFFARAKQVDTKTLHDHYDQAPCYIEGTLTYRSKSCEWEIRAGATGHIKCGNRNWYFACDRCTDLFDSKAAK